MDFEVLLMENNMAMDLMYRLQKFLEDEALSCSMDFGCVTPLYVYRMWGGSVAYDEIESALNYLKVNNYDN